MLLCSLQAIILLLRGGLRQPWLAATTLAVCVLVSLFVTSSAGRGLEDRHLIEARRRISR
jgi:hypothetical protein